VRLEGLVDAGISAGDVCLLSHGLKMGGVAASPVLTFGSTQAVGVVVARVVHLRTVWYGAD